MSFYSVDYGEKVLCIKTEKSVEKISEGSSDCSKEIINSTFILDTAIPSESVCPSLSAT